MYINIKLKIQVFFFLQNKREIIVFHLLMHVLGKTIIHFDKIYHYMTMEV